MKAHVIAFFSKTGEFQHAIIENEEGPIIRHYDLLKETRSAEKLPVMHRYVVELGEPVDTHLKEPRT